MAQRDLLIGVPGNWMEAKIGDVVELNPILDKAKIENDLVVSFAPMSAVGAGDGSIDLSEERIFASVKSGFTNFQQGDVLFAKIAPCMENGKMAVVPKVRNGYGFGSTEFHVLRPQKGIDARYLYHFISAKNFRNAAQYHMTGAVGQKRVPASYLFEFQMPIAPYHEQIRIVEEIGKQFSRLDEAVASLKRAKANLKRYKAAVLKAAVEGKLTTQWRKEHPDVEPAEKLLQRILAERRIRWEEAELKKMIIAERGRKNDSWKKKYRNPIEATEVNKVPLPNTWKWAMVDQLGFIVRGASPRPAGDPRYFGGKIPWITVGDLTKDDSLYLNEVPSFVTEEGKKASRFIEAGTFLLTNSGATLGVPKITNIGGCINDGSVALLFLNNVLKKYLYFFFTNITNRLRQINQGAAQPNLNTTIVRNIAIPLPPEDEQKVIITEIENRMSIIGDAARILEQNLRRAEHLRQSILNKAFSGKLVPQDPNDEPAAVLLERIRLQNERHKDKGAGDKIP